MIFEAYLCNSISEISSSKVPQLYFPAPCFLMDFEAQFLGICFSFGDFLSLLFFPGSVIVDSVVDVVGRVCKDL